MSVKYLNMYIAFIILTLAFVGLDCLYAGLVSTVNASLKWNSTMTLFPC